MYQNFPKILVILAVGILLAARPASAQLDDRALARHIYKLLNYESFYLYNFNKLYSSYFTGIEHQRLLEGKKAKSQKWIAAASRASAEVFWEEYGEDIKQSTIEILIRRFSGDEMRRIMQFYTSPVGEKLRHSFSLLLYDFDKIGMAANRQHKQKSQRDPEFKKAFVEKVTKRINQKLKN